MVVTFPSRWGTGLWGLAFPQHGLQEEIKVGNMWITDLIGRLMRDAVIVGCEDADVMEWTDGL